MSREVVICYTRCEPCMYGSHYDEPTWHTWAGVEDIEHAAATGQPDPSSQPCACHHCGTPPSDQQRAADAAAIVAARDQEGAA